MVKKLDVILQLLKKCSQLLVQFYLKPSELYEFVKQNRKNQYLFILSVFMGTLFLGMLLVLPLYFLYKNLIHAFLFVFLLACALALAVALATGFALTGTNTTLCAGIGAIIGIFTFAFIGAFVGAFIANAIGFLNESIPASRIAESIGGTDTNTIIFIIVVAVSFLFALGGAFIGVTAGIHSGTFAGTYPGVFASSSIAYIFVLILGISLLPSSNVEILIYLSIAGCFIFCYNAAGKIHLKNNKELWLGILSLIAMVFAGGGGLPLIESHEIIIYLFFFFIGYISFCIIDFVGKSKKFEKSFYNERVILDDVTHFRFGKAQRMSIIWGPLIAILLHLLMGLNIAEKLHPKIILAASCFAFMPIFILHIPDYFLCLPLWYSQRRKILHKKDSAETILEVYDQILLFKHEMLFLQLPGLHKIMTFFAKNKEIGIRKTLKYIEYIYWFTFQQKQAKKSIIALGQDNNNINRYIHFLLEDNNHTFLTILARHNPLAELYIILFGEELKEEIDRIINTSFLLSFRKFSSYDYLSANLAERICIVFKEMEKKEGYVFNDEMVKTLKLAHKLLKTENLKNFLNECQMIEILNLPKDIKYFRDLYNAGIQIKKIKESLLKIKSIEDFETKRSLWEQQIEYLDLLSITVEDNFYEPFLTIWENVISHYAELVDNEINLQGAAFLTIELKRIKGNLRKLEAIERIETKQFFLSQQKESIKYLLKEIEDNRYGSGQVLWKIDLNRYLDLAEKEVKLLQGSASLIVGLKNSKLMASKEKRKLYFEIQNKGQELATDVSIHIEARTSSIVFLSHKEREITLIESGATKEIYFPIIARKPETTNISGVITFSDRAREGKKIEFSFPLNILKKKKEFEVIENPYIAGQPLKGDTTLFFGREDVYNNIDTNIMVADDHHTIVCHGLRRTGKSSLLYWIKRKGFRDERLVPINIDVQGIDDEKDFYYTLSNYIIEEIAAKNVSPIESFSQFKKFLEDIREVIGKRIVVFMVDEFEELQMRVEDGRISRTVFSNIRHLMQHEDKLIFLFCGTHKLEEMSADYWSIFFNSAMYVKISHLKRGDAIRLIKEPVKGQLVFDDLAVEQILKMSGRQPFLIQLICRNIVNDLNENKKKNNVVINDVDDVVEKVILGGDDHFSDHIWKESSSLEHLILSITAEELTHKQLDHIDRDVLFEKIESVNPAFSKKQVFDVLDKLVTREILNEKDLLYYFPVNILRKWLVTRYPLRKVIEET